MTRCTFGDTSVFFCFPKLDRNRSSHWMHFCLYMSHRISHVLLFTNWLAAILYHQLLKFHPFDWLIEIYLQTEGQSTHQNMVIPQCTHGIPPMYWTPPDVLMVSPLCTHGIPPMYWTSPDVLKTHYTGWWYRSNKCLVFPFCCSVLNASVLLSRRTIYTSPPKVRRLVRIPCQFFIESTPTTYLV